MAQRFVLFLFLWLVATLPAYAERVLTPDASAIGISLTETEIPQGAVLRSELTHVFQISKSEDYVGLLQDFDYQTSDGLLVITCIYGAFKSPQNAMYAFQSLRISDRSGNPEQVAVGDQAFGRHPGTICFLQDTAVIYLKVERGIGYNVESDIQIERIKDEFLCRMLRKLERETARRLRELGEDRD
ncbi:MAG: hypothetical protein KC800_30880 [Candidatus Eremiobacteraeota bacterium]|nr:hypothetical protein [Candidatus Eremiobacteraeota bacterium]